MAAPRLGARRRSVRGGHDHGVAGNETIDVMAGGASDFVRDDLRA
jgi:hypothetical protein